ncbi:MAG: FAD/NAD(P)-binding protein, partial [Phycisphaerales bacterium]
LNVPAGRMGAFPEDPGAFHRWLEARRAGAFHADDFVPRALFGEDLLETVAAARAEAGDRIALVRDAVVHVDRLPSRIELLLASGRSTVADAVIVAPGMPPARAPWNRVDHGAPRGTLIADPWETGAFEAIDPGAEVLVLGSGLTAIDVAQGLRRAGHVGVIRMVSRNGRLPLAHAVPGEPAATIDPAALGGGPSAVMHAVRALARTRAKAGLGWQGAGDAIRPHATAVWQSWSPAQRRRFLRHARPAWEVHRHRAPRAVLDDLGQQMLEGTIVVERGALVALHPASGDAVEAQVKGPDGVWRSHRVDRIFNCIGPAMGIRDTVDPMLGSLLRSGLAVEDEAGIGLRSGPDGELVARSGIAADRIVLVGALRRGDLWESTAVPELRVQAARAAAHVAATLAGAQAG